MHSNQVTIFGQQCYPSHSQTRNDWSRDRGPNSPPGNSKHYPYWSDGGCGGPNGAPSACDGSHSDNPYRAASYISSSSTEFGGSCRDDKHTQQHD